MSYLANCYKSYTDFKIENYFDYKTEVVDKHPNVNKINIVANHIFRLLPMIAFAEYMPFSPAVNCSLMAAGSLFYRVTIERLCPLKFALVSCFGAIAYKVAKQNSLGALSLVPITLYTAEVLRSAFTYKPCCRS